MVSLSCTTHECQEDTVSGIEPIVLNAGRFTLRPPIEDDAVDAQAMLADPDIRQWMPGPTDRSLDSITSWCRRSANWSDGTFAMWTVTDDAEVVGTGLLLRIDAVDQLTAWVAYRTAPWVRHRGIATQVAVRLSEFAFDSLGLERLELHHAVANRQSCGVAHRAGYTLEGSLIKGYRDDAGRRWDTHVHGRLRDGL